jgi:hypothetical protein
MPLVLMFADVMVIRHENECGRPKTFQNGHFLSRENYSIQEHED